VAQRPVGTVQAVDQVIRLSGETWYREVAQQCWTRGEPGPVRLFNTTTEAETYAATFRPIALQGVGQTATREVNLSWPVTVATFTHSGRSNFIVHSFRQGKDDSLVNEIGTYRGQTAIAGAGPIVFDVRADGAWTIQLEALKTGGSPAVSGRGDTVTALFNPPAAGAWEIKHDGASNFIVHAECAGGTVSVQNEIGPVAGSRVISFRTGPCFWEVQADGNWSLTPR
jgi:hypothetical protein